MSYFNTMYGTDDENTQLPVEMIATVNGFSRENQPIIELGKELIRCKDCKFWNRHDGTFPDFDDKKWHECKQLYPFTSASGDSAVTPSWFYCGYAERKEE